MTGSPKLTAAKRRGDQQIRAELDRIETALDHTHANLRMLLALALIRDGHAKGLSDAIPLADDLERVRALYPDPAD